MPDINKLSDQAMRDLLRLQAQYERKIASVLKKALDEIRAEMSRIYEKYAIDGILSKADMARYARYTAMESNILSKLDPAIKKSLATIKRLSPEQYNAAFFHAAWVLDNATGLRLSWGVINTDAIRRAFSITDPMNKDFAEALKNYSMAARRKIRIAINNGLAQGKSYIDMMKDIRDALNKSNYEAMRIIRTEGQSAIAAGTSDAYDRALADGVEGEPTWNATLDSRTRDVHANMDGKKKESDGLFHLSNGETCPYPGYEGLSAAQRINCRCRLRFEISGYSPQLRRTRDQGLIPYQSYAEWRNNYGPILH